MREELGFPGMRVLQNGFYAGARYDQPHNYPRHCAAYTGTHDNDTIVGWFRDGRRDRGPDGLTTAARALRLRWRIGEDRPSVDDPGAVPVAGRSGGDAAARTCWGSARRRG